MNFYFDLTRPQLFSFYRLRQKLLWRSTSTYDRVCSIAPIFDISSLVYDPSPLVLELWNSSPDLSSLLFVTSSATFSYGPLSITFDTWSFTFFQKALHVTPHLWPLIVSEWTFNPAINFLTFHLCSLSLHLRPWTVAHHFQPLNLDL